MRFWSGECSRVFTDWEGLTTSYWERRAPTPDLPSSHFDATPDLVFG
jgi:hypothetical protein